HPDTHTLSLHDALPISHSAGTMRQSPLPWERGKVRVRRGLDRAPPRPTARLSARTSPTGRSPRRARAAPPARCPCRSASSPPPRSEEHTSELQSLRHLV